MSIRLSDSSLRTLFDGNWTLFKIAILKSLLYHVPLSQLLKNEF